MKKYEFENKDVEFWETYGDKLISLKNNDFNQCPTTDFLVDYFNNQLSKIENEKIEDHIDKCPLCTSAIANLITAEQISTMDKIPPHDWSTIEKAIDEKFYSFLETQTKNDEARIVRPSILGDAVKIKIKDSWDSFFSPAKLIYAGSLAVLIIMSLYGFVYLSRPVYFDLAKIEAEKQHTYRSAIAAESGLAQGIRLINEQKPENAINLLKDARERHPENYAAHYYSGLAYLFTANISLPGLSYNYDVRQVAEGIIYLLHALTLSNGNQFYQEDCLWYLGKAHLMLGELEAALNYFKKITELNQMDLLRKEAAQEMMSAIERMK